MKDILGLAFDAAVSGIGSLGVGYMAWQINAYSRRAGVMPRRVARLWGWFIVLGLCGSAAVLCFGANELLTYHSGFEWLLFLEFGVGGWFGTVLFRIENPQLNRRSRRREPDDDPAGGDVPLRQQQPADGD